MRKFGLALSLLLMNVSALATSITLDFEDGSFESQGFRVYESGEPPEFGPYGVSVGGGTASAYYINMGLERIDGGLFTLESFDGFGQPYGFNVCGAGYITGETASGEILEFSAHTACSQWKTDVLGAEWTNQVRVEFQPYSMGDWDNIVVSNVVPLPAAAWLFLSALTAAGVWRRSVS